MSATPEERAESGTSDFERGISDWERGTSTAREETSAGARAEQGPGRLYAGAGGVSSPAASTRGSTSQQVRKAKSVIRVAVNRESTINAEAFVRLLNQTPGIVPEFKNKLKYDKKANAIVVPDYSQDAVVTGKEWLFDLGRAGNDWELTTATLILGLEEGGYTKLKEDVQVDEERGTTARINDPDDILIRPSRDDTETSTRWMGGLTVPTRTMVAKNARRETRPQVVRLNSGKGLIILANRAVVKKRGKFVQVRRGGKLVPKEVPIPRKMIAMAFFHELSAHACFFQNGQNAAHDESPLVDRNYKQAEESYQVILRRDRDSFEQSVDRGADALNKRDP
ncbi:hypothetical protein [Agromyces bauzanensis]|uniref:Uncharacterized protein n=1 Tax=Agromyces bauzanensis TaxID=1308924 RepID=A0A917UQP6_9MICO|nr:hypothetical protein [Agromyces bauzanensis]GGJ76356.1 hypothetical protein GCM10011372_13190 [Agromyces bauzanensis]